MSEKTLRSKIEAFMASSPDFDCIRDCREDMEKAVVCFMEVLDRWVGYSDDMIDILYHVHRDTLLRWVDERANGLSLNECIFEDALEHYDPEAQFFDEFMEDLMKRLAEARLYKLCDALYQSEYLNFDLYDSGVLQTVAKFELVDDPLRVNLILGTSEEKNQDFSTNHTLRCMVSEEIDREEEIDARSVQDGMLAWLVRQQGYRFTDLVPELSSVKDSPFLKSVRKELMECHSYMPAVTVCLRLDLEEYTRMLEGGQNIRIGKDATIGLYDCWNGAGGTLDIALERDLVISPDMIHAVQIEEEHNDTVKENYCYSVNTTYGLTSGCWKNVYAPTDEPVYQVSPEEREEDVVMLKKYWEEREEVRANPEDDDFRPSM